MKMISFYNLDGSLYAERPLDRASIENCHGMKIKCILLDGSERVGFANPFYSFEKGRSSFNSQELDYITLETFVNLDEATHTFVGDEEHRYDINREAVPISLISHIDAVLYSGLRWGGLPTNRYPSVSF